MADSAAAFPKLGGGIVPVKVIDAGDGTYNLKVSSATPPVSNTRVTDAADTRTTSAGDTRVTAQ